jgi:hypothetical protein
MEEKNNNTNNNTKINNKQLEAILTQLEALTELTQKQQAENQELKRKLDELSTQKTEDVTFLEPVEAQTFADAIEADRMVEIVHLLENTSGIVTMLKLADGRSLAFRRYGDTARIRYFELQQLLSIYHDLFYEDRIFTLGNRDQDVALAERLPTFDKTCLTKEETRLLLDLPVNKLIEIYERVCDTHKELILSMWQRGYFEGKDMRYRDLDKINALNKVSNQKMKSVYDNYVDTK